MIHHFRVYHQTIIYQATVSTFRRGNHAPIHIITPLYPNSMQLKPNPSPPISQSWTFDLVFPTHKCICISWTDSSYLLPAPYAHLLSISMAKLWNFFASNRHYLYLHLCLYLYSYLYLFFIRLNIKANCGHEAWTQDVRRQPTLLIFVFVFAFVFLN